MIVIVGSRTATTSPTAVVTLNDGVYLPRFLYAWLAEAPVAVVPSPKDQTMVAGENGMFDPSPEGTEVNVIGQGVGLHQAAEIRESR